MEQRTVELTAKAGLCSSCGICKNMCPQSCISWDQSCGMYKPSIDAQRCVRCGICAQVCPGLSFAYEKQTPLEAMTGSVRGAYNAWSRDAQIRHVSASGGVISTMIRTLLLAGEYDAAFCVDTYDYASQLQTNIVDREHVSGEISKTPLPKSRYLPVSHEHAVAYIKGHRDKRLILVGSSCAVRGLLNVIQTLKLNREQYLLIGLFCDQVFNYNVYPYFQQAYGQGKPLTGLHFKNKESGGWPGNMKFLFADGTSAYQDQSARGQAKAYFMPERCLYCVDKLNVCADISLGDNYTEENSSSLGSNSVILRTEQGERAFRFMQEHLECCPVAVEKIQRAQYLEGRMANLYFGDLKQQEIEKAMGETVCLNAGIIRQAQCGEYKRAFRRKREMLYAGAVYDQNPAELDVQIRKTARLAKDKGVIAFVRRLYRGVKRRLNRR